VGALENLDIHKIER